MRGPEHWRESAACRGKDTNLWHPYPAGHQHKVSDVYVGELAKSALAICAACPVVGECLDFAFATKQREGIWGGLVPAQREQLMRQRRRQAG